MTSGPKIGAEEERRARLPSHLLVLFIWFALQITNAFSNLRYFDLEPLGAATLLNSAVLTFGAVLALLWYKGSRNRLLGISFLLFVLQLLSALVMLRADDRTGLWNISLYFVFLLAVPGLFKVWPFAVETAGAALCFGSVLVFTAESGLSGSLNLIAVAALGCIAVLVVSRRGTALGEDRVAALEEEGFRQLERSEASALAERAWSVALLQATMVAVLIFLDFAFSAPESSPPYAFKIAALLLIVGASCLYSIIKRTQLGSAIIVHTVLTGIVLSLAGAGEPQNALIHSVIPLIYLSLTTAALPWRLESQIIIAWGLFWGNLAVELLSRLRTDLPFALNELTASYSMVLASEPSSKAFLALGLVFSVLLARFLRQQRLRSFTVQIDRYQATSQAPGESGSTAQILQQRSALALIAARTESLIKGVFVLGVYSCLVSTALLLREDASRWAAAGMVWLLFLFVWSMLVYANHRHSAHRPLWSFAAFVSVVLICWPSILLVRLSHPDLFWLCWPISLLIGLGFIPWGLRELIPLLAVSLITGVEIASELTLPLWGLLTFILAAIFSVLSSFHRSKKLKEASLTSHFDLVISDCKDEREVLRYLADHLCNLCDGFSAVTGSGDELELLRNGRVFALNPKQWSFSLLDADDGVSTAEGGVICTYLNWVPPQAGLLDERFGVFSPQHGLLIKFPVPVPRAELNQANAEAAIFLGFEVPSVRLLKAGELELVRSLVSVARLRLEVLTERRARQLAEENRDMLTAERELELGALVHDINNTVQDLTVLCENVLEDPALAAAAPDHRLVVQLQRVTAIARSMAMTVSDAKRRRELEKQLELPARELVDIAGVIEEIAAFSAVRAERKRITIALEKSAPSGPLWVKVSAKEHLETILRNLLNNATAYSNPGSWIKIALFSENGSVRTAVTDNGPGLASEEIELIFQPGQRGKAGAQIPGGLGIGLYQSRRVAEAAGGTLEALSNGPGSGATFVLTLPLQSAPAVPAVPGPWALMVDDQVALTDFYAKIAQALHLSAGIATSVQEAVNLCVERGKPVFVLTDVHLAGGNGLDLVRFIREQYGSAIPVLVVSGIDDVDIAARARSAGATDFVAKPIGRRALFARIQSLLTR